MSMDAYIDGVVPQPITDSERGFLRGLLIGNLLRIHAAFDEEGNDLSAQPKKAADYIEKLQNQRHELIAEVESLRKQRDELQSDFEAYKIGSEEAFGTVVDQKKSLKSELDKTRRTISFQQDVIFDFRGQREKLLEAIKEVLRELDACQRVIFLASDYGFDPAYVNGAKAAIKVADSAIKSVKGESC